MHATPFYSSENNDEWFPFVENPCILRECACPLMVRPCSLQWTIPTRSGLVDNHNHSGRLLHVCCSYESPPQLILYVHNKKSTAHSMVFILYISHWRSPSHITHSYLFLWLCPSHATKIWRTLNSPVRRIMQLTDSIIVLAGTMAPVCPAKWFAVGYFPASHIEYLRVFLYCWWLWITGRQWWSSL